MEWRKSVTRNGVSTGGEDGATIGCSTFLWPNISLGITLDNQLNSRLVDVVFTVRNATGYQLSFKRHDGASMQRVRSGSWRNGFDMSIADVVECFGLDDQRIKNPDPITPGTWSGWFLYHYRGPRPGDPAR